jgi:hypothetical protein
VTATAVADATKQAVAALTVAIPLVARAQMRTIRDSAPREPFDLASVRDTVDVVAGQLPVPCSDLEGAQLRVTNQGRDSVLPALSFQPALTGQATLVFRWNTDPCPDGTYEIQVVGHFSDGPIPSNRIPVVMQPR